MSLEAQLQASRVKLIAKSVADAKKITTTLTDMVVDATPVLTGALKGDWTGTTGAPASTGKHTTDPSGDTTKLAIHGVVNSLPNDKDWTFYLSNNKLYGTRVEYLGWSSKAPYGMVRVSLARLASAIGQVLRG